MFKKKKKKQVEHTFGSVILKLGWINSKCNCVVLIHVRNSFPSNILSPDLKNASTQFLRSEGLFRVFSFLQLLCCILKKRKKDFISLLPLEQNAFGKDCCLWQQAKGFLKGRFLFLGWNGRYGNQSSRLQQLFTDTLHSGGPFPSCWQSICICEPEFSASSDTYPSN